MTNALAAFLRERADERGLRNRDIELASGLSRQVVSKWMSDTREQIRRLPDRQTLEGFARALGVPTAVLLGKAVEALGLGYTGGDFINSVGTATDEELFDELRRRQESLRNDLDRLAAMAATAVDEDQFAEAARSVLIHRGMVRGTKGSGKVRGTKGSGKAPAAASTMEGLNVDLIWTRTAELALQYMWEAEGDPVRAVMSADHDRERDPDRVPVAVVRQLGKLASAAIASAQDSAELARGRLSETGRARLIAAADDWQRRHPEFAGPDNADQVLRHYAGILVKNADGVVATALRLARQQEAEYQIPEASRVVEILEEMALSTREEALAVAARSDPSGMASRGQRARREMDNPDENQDIAAS